MPSGEGTESSEVGSEGASSGEDDMAESETASPGTREGGDRGSDRVAGDPTEAGGPTVPEDARPQPSAGAVPRGSQTSGERTAALDDELARSLAEFDGELLREQELLEKERQEEARAAAAEESAMGGETGGYSGSGE